MAKPVHIVDDVTDLAAQRPVMVMALEGFLDGGSAAMLAAGALQGGAGGQVVASFDIEQFHDYRARRPPMSFMANRYTDYEEPTLLVRRYEDQQGRPYLVLSGPEPDFKWESFVKGVLEVVERCGVRLVIGLGSIPMAVPHTRPMQLTNHATREDLLTQRNLWSGVLRVPSHAQALVQVRLAEAGLAGCGYVAHIPHYLAQTEYPLAGAELARAAAEVAGLDVDLSALDDAAAERQAEINDQVSESSELASLVAGLEEQYDAFQRGNSGLLAGDDPLPTGEELGAEFERFLAGLDEDGTT